MLLTDGFTFESKQNEAFMKKVKDHYKEKDLHIYNVSLEEGLKKLVLETTKKELPLLFEQGKVKEL